MPRKRGRTRAHTLTGLVRSLFLCRVNDYGAGFVTETDRLGLVEGHVLGNLAEQPVDELEQGAMCRSYARDGENRTEARRPRSDACATEHCAASPRRSFGTGHE